MFLDSDFMVTNGFQRLTVLELNFASQDGSRRRSKRALPPDVGVIAKTALQFDPKGRSLDVQKYESEFRSLTANGTRLPKGERLNASFTIKGKIIEWSKNMGEFSYSANQHVVYFDRSEGMQRKIDEPCAGLSFDELWFEWKRQLDNRQVCAAEMPSAFATFERRRWHG